MARFSDGPPATPPDDSAPITSRRGYFWVGAEPQPETGAARGPMFVYWEAPVDVTKPYPIVLVHGGGGQGLDYLGTPDGRPGWSTLLVEQGWVVYVVDRPGHGRSPYDPEALGPFGPPLPIEVLRGIFVPPADGPGAMPFAGLHTQWPGDRSDPNDPALLQFLAVAFPSRAMRPIVSSRTASLSNCCTASGPHRGSNSLGGHSGFLLPTRGPQGRALVQVEPIVRRATHVRSRHPQWGVLQRR